MYFQIYDSTQAQSRVSQILQTVNPSYMVMPYLRKHHNYSSFLDIHTSTFLQAPSGKRHQY